MICLSLDASTKRASVALQQFQGEHATILGYSKSENPRTHSEFLNGAISAVLSQAGLSFEQISLIAVGIGPGSFTGIRVAVNIARAISYIKKTPLVGVGTFTTLLSQVESEQTLCLFNAFKGQAYSALGDSKQKEFENLSLTFDELEVKLQSHSRVIGLGDIFLEFKNLLPSGLAKKIVRSQKFDDYPDAILLGRVAVKMPPTIDWNLIQPLYIRESEAEESLKSK